MRVINTDILPPIYDQVIAYFKGNVFDSNIRAEIIYELVNAIADAAIANIRANNRNDTGKNDSAIIITSDRLSGEYLSRSQIIKRISTLVSLTPDTLEIALLLIESQIDLRLGGSERFEIGDILFEKCEGNKGDIANHTEWCRDILPHTLRGASLIRAPLRLPLMHRHTEGIRILIEGLQLSAALRKAFPYKITVNECLVQPRRESVQTNSNSIRILHISDLHMTELIEERGRHSSKPIGVASHSVEALSKLGIAAREMIPTYDLLIATGDLTCDGKKGSFENVKRFIKSESLSADNPSRDSHFGLNVGIGKMLLVPGNHDRYGDKFIPNQEINYNFEEIFGKPKNDKKKYPYIVGFRPSINKRNQNSLTLLFFVFDSTLPDFSRTNVADQIAKGIIKEVERIQMINEAKEILEAKKVRDLYGEVLDFNPENTIKIAILHHHPIKSLEEEERQKEDKSSFWYRFAQHPIKSIKSNIHKVHSSLMEMEEGYLFLEAARMVGIQLILFGHMHVPYYRVIKHNSIPESINSCQEMHAFCCPSTLEYTVKEKGFYVFDFIDNNNINVDLYISKREKSGKVKEFESTKRTIRIKLNKTAEVL
jgi:hypothetical protein